MRDLKKKGIRILATGRALPSKKVTNEMLGELVETNDAWIRSRTGIASRYQCMDESCLSLAAEAGRRAIARAGIDRSQIGVVIVATSTADSILPSTACMVQRELALSEEVIAFDLSAACTGFMLGVSVAHGLLQNADKQYALIIGAEQLSRIIDYTDRTTCILFGDGAGAAVIGLSDSAYVQRSWSRGDAHALACGGVGCEDQYVKMDGKAVFRFAVGAMEQAVETVMQEAGVTMDEVDLVVCHQANERIIQHVRKKYKGNEDKFYLNIERYGNTSAASIPIALDELYEAGKLTEGTKLVCAGFGAGLTWSGAYIEL